MVTQEKKTLYFTSAGPILRKSVMFVVNVEDIFKKKLLISRFLRWFCSRAPVNITNPYAKQFT